MTLFLIQDVPTPHNNLVAKELDKLVGGNLVQAFAYAKSKDYGFQRELIPRASKVILTGGKVPDFRLTLRAIFDSRALWIVVGWSNPSSRALLLVFCLLRRHFVFWMDEPLPVINLRSSILRSVVLFVLRSSRASIAAVGLPAVHYFTRRGFSESRVSNIPVALARPSNPVAVRADGIESWVGAPFSLLFASRLVAEKGVDVLIHALSLLPAKLRCQIVLLVVGRGPEERGIRSKTKSLGLEKQIVFLDWAEFDELVWLADRADLIVAPSRFDSYGGAALLSLIARKPFIASDSVGAAMDFIDRGVEVPTFPSGNADSLAGLLADFTGQVLNLDVQRNQLKSLALSLNPKRTALDLLRILKENRVKQSHHYRD